MDSDERAEPGTDVPVRRFETLGIILGSAILGSVVAVSVMRIVQNGTEKAAAAGLPGSLLTTGLSVSALVLALAAISISRSAERTIARKSEEINALRAEIFARTERIESSVMCMRKEIADTIYDGFEMLSGEIQENLPSRDVLRADITEAVEHSLAEAMIVVEHQEEKPALSAEAAAVVSEIPVAEPEPEEIKEPISSPVSVPVTDEMREKAERKYSEFKDIVLLGIANYPGVIARKIGEGHYRTEGDDLADGVFIIQNEKVAVCTFCTGDTLIDRFMGESGDSFNGFLRSLVNEIKCGHFSSVFMVFDGKLSGTSPYADALNVLSRRIDAGTFARFELFEGSPDVIIPELTERVSQLMEKPAGAEPESIPEMTFRRQASA